MMTLLDENTLNQELAKEGKASVMADCEKCKNKAKQEGMINTICLTCKWAHAEGTDAFELKKDCYELNRVRSMKINERDNYLPLTIGDKIRKSNESLAEFIKEQFADERVYIHGGVADIEDYLNQPVDAAN